MLKMWHAHYKSIKCMVFSDDGFLLISGSDDGMICVWSMTRYAPNSFPFYSLSLLV